MNIKIDRLKEQDAKELFQFECENRSYFETMVPSRGEDYYQYETFLVRHKELLAEQEMKISFFYLIRRESGVIIGRINMIDIDKAVGSAHIGYRVGKEYIGRGVANMALQLLLETAASQRIRRIFAKTTTSNIASQKVLEKNSFIKIKIENETINLNGHEEHFIYYIWNFK